MVLNQQDKIVQVEQCCSLTASIAQIFLCCVGSQPLVYEAGQYIKIVHAGLSTYPFSIASAPHVPFELHLHHPKENIIAREILQQITEQKQLTIRGPYGSCTASRIALSRPVIFLARGTGFAPIKAVIEALIDRPDCPPIHLYWSAAGWQELYMRELVEVWVKTHSNFNYTAVLTREYIESVRFGSAAQIILQDYPDLSGYQVYASGPQAMIYPALYAFQQHGLAREWFYSDVLDYKP